MENKSITITTNNLRQIIIDVKYQAELAKDLVEDIGEDETASGSIAYNAGQIYSKLDRIVDQLFDVLEEHIPYVDDRNEEENN